MQRTLIVLVVGLLSVGCGKTLEEKVIGEYEHKSDNDTYKLVFLDNDISEWYKISNKVAEYKWSIVKGEIHVIDDLE